MSKLTLKQANGIIEQAFAKAREMKIKPLGVVVLDDSGNIVSAQREDGATMRRLTLAGGGAVLERLEQKNDKERTYTYSIVEGPLPVADYTSTLRVREGKNAQSCTVEWSSDFEPKGASESEAVKVMQGVYAAGFENLKKMFGG